MQFHESDEPTSSTNPNLAEIDDVRIVDMRPLVPPGILIEEIPQTAETASFVAASRREIEAVLLGRDLRLVVVVGPCSIHEVAAAEDYAHRLQELSEQLHEDLILVMRAYFEKPRTTVGWKGLINDPNLDESYQVNKGLRLARGLLRRLAEMRLPAATEFLDMTAPQHIADFVSWGAIGARTTQSQTHRELASGLSMPIGFKNGTDGSIQAAVDAVDSARRPHWFPSNTKQGVAALFQTTGNPFGHVILRGGDSGPNYSACHVSSTLERLRRAGLREHLMIDASHANSGKDESRQKQIALELADRLREGEPGILGLMLESFLVAGRQDARSDAPLEYGKSITDACMGFDDTREVLERLAEASRFRRERGPEPSST